MNYTPAQLRQALSLYLALDRGLIGARDWVTLLEEAVAGGVTAVQLREKAVSAQEFYATAKRLLPVTRRLQVPLIINDRLDIMLAADADGCHLGRNDLPLAEARRLAPGKILGYSVNRLEHLQHAVTHGADYVGIGPAFATGTKPDAAAVLGPQTLLAIAAQSPLPCVAIGGISTGNVAQLRGGSLAGVCVISAILSAPDPRAAAQQLRFEPNGRPHLRSA